MNEQKHITERKPEWAEPWMVERGTSCFYLCNDGWHIFKTCGDSETDQQNAERLRCILNTFGALGESTRRNVADAISIVEYVFAEGRGTEFFPRNLDGSPNELFEKAHRIVTELQNAREGSP